MKKLSMAKTTFAALSMMATPALADDTKAPRAIHDGLLSLPLVMCAAGDESDVCNPKISEEQMKAFEKFAECSASKLKSHVEDPLNNSPSKECDDAMSQIKEHVENPTKDSGGYATACLALPNEITCTDEVLTKMWTDNGCGTAEDFNYHFKTPIAIAPSYVCASAVELKQRFKPQIK